MLCPEVWNFPAPKVHTKTSRDMDLKSVDLTMKMNNYYKSLVVACPDSTHIPDNITNYIRTDTDYYKLEKCSVTAFFDPTFIENFVKNGFLYCLSVGNDCVVDNCVALEPDGTVIIHLPEYTLQELGLHGSKKSYGLYDIEINLKSNVDLRQLRAKLQKLPPFNFIVIWEPTNDEICPSSIAKYFYEHNIEVSVFTQNVQLKTVEVNSIPGSDAEPSELAEWVGLQAIGGDMNPKYDYISTYKEPESEKSIETSKMTLLIAKGFFTPRYLNKLCLEISNYVKTRDVDSYWASLSVQSNDNSPWKYMQSVPRIFQHHQSSISVFFTEESNFVHLVSQIDV